MGKKNIFSMNVIWLFVIAGCFLLDIWQDGFYKGAWNALFWLYFCNCVLLSFYCIWNGLELSGLGLDVSILLLIALIFVFLYGLVRIEGGTFTGLIFSLILGLIGIGAFAAHLFFVEKVQKERGPAEQVSLFIMAAAFIISLLQTAMTIYSLNKGGSR